MIYVTKFRVNDLQPSKGKQIEFNSRVVSEFFEFKHDTHEVVFDCKSVANNSISQKIKVRMTLSPARGDYKVYQNTDNSPDLKDFFLDVLHLHEDNINDYYAIKKKSEAEYTLYYIPASSLFSEFYPFISKEQILYIPEEGYQEKDMSYQQIFFGTPGSGKSHRVKELTEGKKVHRTTFHPDSDYANFVGCYKPTMQSSIEDNLSLEELIQRIPEIQNEDNAIGKFTIKYYRSIQKLQATPDREDLRRKIQEAKGAGSDGKSQYAYMNQAIALGAYLEKEKLWRDSSTISYSFTPQVFTEAYIDAWKNLEEEVFLVIEEINRGNCAQIFGDLFQLLDRNNEGYSDYPITADSDLREHLVRELGKDHKGIKEGKISLPPNLYILATMNTSDQSLFPMDSAFKRRWDWEYVPVDYSESVPSSGFVITLGDEEYRWVEFLKMANERIRKATDSEDKQMGNFFIKGNVSEAEFKSKVMFYLWNEVCKDEYGTQNNFFRYRKNNEEVEFSFNDLYQTDGLEILHGFMAYLEVTPSSTKEDTEEESEEPGQD